VGQKGPVVEGLEEEGRAEDDAELEEAGGSSGVDEVGVSDDVEAVGCTLLACKMLRFFMASLTLVQMCSFGMFGVVGLSWLSFIYVILVNATCAQGTMQSLPGILGEVP